MNTVVLDLPAFGYIVVTRAALAFGIGLLLADRVPEDRRRAIGLMLVAVGAATTIPAVKTVVGGVRRTRESSTVGRDRRLKGTIRLPRKGDDDNF